MVWVYLIIVNLFIEYKVFLYDNAISIINAQKEKEIKKIKNYIEIYKDKIYIKNPIVIYIYIFFKMEFFILLVHI